MLLELEDVRRSFAGAPGGPPIEVLRGVSLELAAGQSLAISGPSGSGKSTLLHLMGALDRPDGGQVRVAGRAVAELDAVALARLRNQEIGFVFQRHHLLPQCTVLENCLLPTLPAAELENGEGAVARATRLLQRVGLGERLQHRPGQLSGGECQRAAVVRALVNRPRLLLADEPTGSLDGATAEQLVRLLLALQHDEELALVVVTHSAQIADAMQRHCRLDAGVVAPGEGSR